jgi:hypothetical protein
MPTYQQNKLHAMKWDLKNKDKLNKLHLKRYYWKKERLIYLAILLNSNEN